MQEKNNKNLVKYWHCKFPRKFVNDGFIQTGFDWGEGGRFVATVQATGGGIV
jgi:hypothetical protein